MTDTKPHKALLDLVGTIREMFADANKEPFNLFSVLRSASDEVRLHSRFLAAMLDPELNHELGTKAVELLCRHIGVEGFSSDSICVSREYKNIDILITSHAEPNQALIIENKIYAGDQDRQLKRYYEAMQEEGYLPGNIWVAYLTLDGYEPGTESLDGLKEILKDQDRAVMCLSYAGDIQAWLKTCKQVVVDNVYLREAINQYLDLIKTLTGQSRSQAYMAKLKELLKTEQNISLMFDITNAKNEVAADLLYVLFEKIHFALQQKEIFKGHVEDLIPRDAILAKLGQQRNKGFGLMIKVPNSPALIGIECLGAFYWGVKLNKTEHPQVHAEIQRQCQSIKGGAPEIFWPVWGHVDYSSELDFNSHNMSKDIFQILLNDDDIDKIVANVVKNCVGMWNCIVESASPNNLTEGKNINA